MKNVTVKSILIISLLFSGSVLNAQYTDDERIKLTIKDIKATMVSLYQDINNNDKTALEIQKLASFVQSLRPFEYELDEMQSALLHDARLMLYQNYKEMSKQDLEAFKVKLMDYVTLVEDRLRLLNDKKDDIDWLVKEAEKGLALRLEAHTNPWKSDIAILAELIPYYVGKIENYEFENETEYNEMMKKALYYQDVILNRLQSFKSDGPEFFNLDIARLMNYTARLQMFIEISQKAKIKIDDDQIRTKYISRMTDNLLKMKNFMPRK